LHQILLARLESAHQIDWSRATIDPVFVHAKCAKKGPQSAAAGPSPVERAKASTQRHQIVDKNGLTLITTLSGANVPDGKMLIKTVKTIRAVGGKPGRPRGRSVKLHGDKSYNNKKRRKDVRRRGIIPRLAHQRVESS
jgi:hypothetical protein